MTQRKNNAGCDAGEPPALPKLAIHSRGYLPHIEGAEYQMITYRLNDALPVGIIRNLKGMTGKNQRLETEAALDAGYGQCWLLRPDVAKLVVDNWRQFDGQRYELITYVVMPNHVHILIRVFEQMLLSRIVHGWKSYTAKKIIALLMKAGEPPVIPGNPSPLVPLWQPEYWDRYIRDPRHYEVAIEYIHNNPVKAGLVPSAQKWRWSSAYEAR